MRQRARKAQVEYFLVLISANVRWSAAWPALTVIIVADFGEVLGLADGARRVRCQMQVADGLIDKPGSRRAGDVACHGRRSAVSADDRRVGEVVKDFDPSRHRKSVLNRVGVIPVENDSVAGSFRARRIQNIDAYVAVLPATPVNELIADNASGVIIGLGWVQAVGNLALTVDERDPFRRHVSTVVP